MNSLNEPYVQIIGFITKTNFRKYPKWINGGLEYKKYVVLNGNTSEKEVDLFLIEILCYNKIYINREPEDLFKSLIHLEQAIIGGGILFAGNENSIFPSCCCGLEQWRDVLESIRNRHTPWLGHDPFPTIEFMDNIVRVWSDNYKEKARKQLLYIDYSYKDLVIMIKNLEKDFKAFIQGPLYQRLKSIDEDLAPKVIIKFNEWFKVE